MNGLVSLRPAIISLLMNGDETGYDNKCNQSKGDE
ncbi:hypothetical protein M493_04080 [Geobacillus genomosp. 3]|uniref:Uncharacterized protein n=1 Tax=Geobacillus genomosp. 3 TaxID=1921421 RepID=S5Z2B0_GEOG3|nr:hypothetical protein M493_04080 [Geobacillus genomosp. 3]